jgi:hypothetical protein
VLFRSHQRPEPIGKFKAGESKGAPQKNPVVSALNKIAHSLRSINIADCNATDLDGAKKYRDDWDSERIYIVYSRLGIYNVEEKKIFYEFQSARTAARFALNDSQKGFWSSPSNKIIEGISELERDVSWALSDKECMANQLNKIHVSTCIRYDGSFKLWGNRVAIKNLKLMKYKFVNLVRLKDAIDETVLKAHLYFVDDSMDTNYFETVVANVNDYLASMRKKGAIINGKCWKDQILNTPKTMEDGESYFTYDFTGKYPAERIIFTSKLTNKYLEEI